MSGQSSGWWKNLLSHKAEVEGTLEETVTPFHKSAGTDYMEPRDFYEYSKLDVDTVRKLYERLEATASPEPEVAEEFIEAVEEYGSWAEEDPGFDVEAHPPTSEATRINHNGKSKTHASAFVMEDGSWACSACDSESFDFEMFEEAGDAECCMEKNGGLATALGGVGSEKALQDLKRVKAAIDDVKEAAEKSSTIYDEFSRAITSFDGHTKAVWTVPEEIKAFSSGTHRTGGVVDYSFSTNLAYDRHVNLRHTEAFNACSICHGSPYEV